MFKFNRNKNVMILMLVILFFACNNKKKEVLKFNSTFDCNINLIDNVLDLWKGKLDNERAIDEKILYSNKLINKLGSFDGSRSPTYQNSFYQEQFFYYDNGIEPSINHTLKLIIDSEIEAKDTLILKKSILLLNKINNSKADYEFDIYLRKFIYKTNSTWVVDKIIFSENFSDSKAFSHPSFKYCYNIDRNTGEIFNFLKIEINHERKSKKDNSTTTFSGVATFYIDSLNISKSKEIKYNLGSEIDRFINKDHLEKAGIEFKE